MVDDIRDYYIVSIVRVSESIAVLYFLYLAAACWRPGVRPRRRLVLMGAASAGAVGIPWVAGHAALFIRDWIPLLYVLIGYYMSGLLFVRASEPIESWLMDWDRRVLGDPTTCFSRWPRAVLAYLDVVYMLCFMLLPAGFAVLMATGRHAETDRYWTLVVGSEFAAFAPLAFMQTRPPWALERPAALPDGAAHRAAAGWVRHLTIGVNTFPSGHVAGSFAVALGVVGASFGLVSVFFVLAFSIALACVVGRYHYVADVVAGVLVAGAIRLVL